MIYIMAYSRKSSIYLFLCFNICFSHAITTSSCTGPAHPRATCLIISWSVPAQLQCQYHCRATAELHQCCHCRAAPTWISSWFWSASLASAGCAWPIQVLSQSDNIRPRTRPSRSPTCSPEWVTLYDFSSAFRVSSCQAEWLWSNANSK